MSAETRGMTLKEYCIRSRRTALCRGCPVCARNVSQKHRHLSFSSQTESERRHA